MSRSNANYDRHITIFSPEGRLYQVEYAFKAVKNSNLTSVALRAPNKCVVGVSLRKKADRLMLDTMDRCSNFFTINKFISVQMTGMPADSRALVYRIREIAADFKFDNGYEIPVRHLANKIGNLNQLYTQHAYMRPYGVVTTVLGFDYEEGVQLYKIDPAGSVIGYVACSAGAKEQEAAAQLEKFVFKHPKFFFTPDSANYKAALQSESTSSATLDVTAIVQYTIGVLQTVSGSEFNRNDIDVCIVDEEKQNVTYLSYEEIDELLNALAERE